MLVTCFQEAFTREMDNTSKSFLEFMELLIADNSLGEAFTVTKKTLQGVFWLLKIISEYAVAEVDSK